MTLTLNCLPFSVATTCSQLQSPLRITREERQSSSGLFSRIPAGIRPQVEDVVTRRHSPRSESIVRRAQIIAERGSSDLRWTRPGRLQIGRSTVTNGRLRKATEG